MRREPRLFEVHDVFTATRGGADQDQAPKDRWTVEHHLLGDHSAKRESEDIARPHTETIEESGGMLRHACNGRRHGARRAPDAGVVEQNQLSVSGEGVRERGIPVVECAREVLEEKQREPGAAAEATVGVAFAALHLEKLCAGVLETWVRDDTSDASARTVL